MDSSDNSNLEKKRPVGHPPFVPTDEDRKMVERLVGLGLTHVQISHLVQDGIDTKTLTKYFRKELDRGFPKAVQKVAGSLMTRIDEGDQASIFFWLKTRARWSEKHQHEITGPDGSPIRVKYEVIGKDKPNLADDD